jgi:hypothetical protein
MRTGVLPESKSQQSSPSLPPSCYRAVCVRLYLTSEAPLRREKATQRAVCRWWQNSLACVNQGGATQLFVLLPKDTPLPPSRPPSPPQSHSESRQTEPTLTSPPAQPFTQAHTTQAPTPPSLPAYLNISLRLHGERTLGLLTLSPHAGQSPLVLRDVHLVLALEGGDDVVHQTLREGREGGRVSECRANLS